MATTKHNIEHGKKQREKIAKLYRETGGNVSAISRAIGLARATVYNHLHKMGVESRPRPV